MKLDPNVTHPLTIKRFKTLEVDLYEIYGDTLDFTDSIYTSAIDKIWICCNIHKEYYEATTHHLLEGVGCPDCGSERINKKRTNKARENFPARAELIHPNKNYYHLVDYKNCDTKVELYCVDCDVPYWITPSAVLNSQGHSSCSHGGFKPNNPATLYYLRVETRNQVCWKIGITNHTVNDRFNVTDLELITEIRIVHYENGVDAYDEEQRILKEFKDFNYQGDPLLSSGNSELFTKDVLELDKSIT